MTEDAPYEVTGHLGKVELRRYPALRVAQVSGMFANEAFWHLFMYITGNNRVRKKIAMTAPVISSELIEMTAPVITSSMTESILAVSDTGTMSFVLPPKYAAEDPPDPLDPVVRLGVIPERDVAAIEFKGRVHHREIEDVTATLLLLLEENGIRPAGQPFLMQYDPPVVPLLLRRNEIGIQIPRRH